MLRRAHLLALILLLPSVALAQRGGGGSKSGKKDDMFGKSDKPPVIRVRDIEDQSPIKLLIDKKKDLKLTDAQVSKLKDSENKLKDVNEPFFKAVDSLTHEMRLGSTQMADSLRNENAYNGLTRVIAGIQANYNASATDAIAGFDADQQAKANEMVSKQREDADKLFRSRLRRPGMP